jgi:protein-ribulosamine 3-kinase
MQPALLAALGAQSATPLAGGCIHRCYRVLIGGVARFAKVNEARLADAFAAEADGLQALHAAAIRAPHALRHGAAGGQAFLLLEFLELQANGDFAALGHMLATAHRRASAAFGWHRDNYIGSTPQANAWCDDWASFFCERRLTPQLELARKNGFDLDLGAATETLKGHRPQPALLHGDLWRGNAAFLANGEPVLFDPAVYYGDREADLAMTELFGGFPPAFYEAYNAVYRLEPGYAKRKHLYNLYHLLNHLNLFGAGYLAQLRSTLRLLLDAL